MKLCLDAGNSRLKWGLHGAGGWRSQGALFYDALENLPSLLPMQPEEKLQQTMACNVAGPEIAARIERLAMLLKTKLDWLSSSRSACGVVNGYDRPEQLGSDRWAALIGARMLHPGPLLVVMAGTATTIDSLDRSGNFQGGLILPGLALMRAALAHNTTGLSEAEGHYQTFPRNTGDAIVSGAIEATVGAIERQAAQMPGALCVISGGAASELAPRLPLPYRQIDNLVLEGLVCAFSLSALPRVSELGE